MPPRQERKPGPQLIGFATGGLPRACRGFGGEVLTETAYSWKIAPATSRKWAVADAIWLCGHGDPREGRPILPLLSVGPVGDGGRQVVGGVSGWRGSRPELENPGNGGNEACGYLGRGEAENMVAVAGNVDVTMDLVLENIESVLGSANVFAVSIDFDN